MGRVGSSRVYGSECLGMKLLQMSQFSGIKNALRQRIGVATSIVAVGVGQPLPPKSIHLHPFLRREGPLIAAAVRGSRLVERAAVQDEARVLGDERPVGRVQLVLPAGGGPVGAVPYGAVQPHLLGREVGAHGGDLAHVPNGDVVDVVRDPVWAPRDPVTVEILGRVEPQFVPLFPAPVHVPVAVEVGLERPLVAAGVAEELQIDLVVAVGIFLVVGGVEGHHHPRRVALRQLQRRLEVAVNVEFLGAEAGAGGLVHGDLDGALVLVGDDVGVSV